MRRKSERKTERPPPRPALHTAAVKDKMNLVAHRLGAVVKETDRIFLHAVEIIVKTRNLHQKPLSDI